MASSDLESMSSSILLQLLEGKAGEKALLTLSEAPEDELRNVQRSIDKIQQEILRRMSW